MGNRRVWVVVAALVFTVGLVAVAIVAAGDDETGGSAEETQEVLSAAEVFLDQEGIENWRSSA